MSRGPVYSRWRDAIGVSDLGPTARAVCCALATYMDAKGECWPSVATLAAVLRRDRRTIQRALGAIEAAGFVTVKRGGGRGVSSTYTAARVPPYEVGKQRQNAPKRAAERALNSGTGAARSTEEYEDACGRLNGAAPRIVDECVRCGERQDIDRDSLLCQACAAKEVAA